MVQRYKFESKSQLIVLSPQVVFVVSNGSKVQIWKQITTVGEYGSNFGRCFQWFKGTNLKANHNQDISTYRTGYVVSNGSKVQIWKQITTDVLKGVGSFLLFPMVQRYKFESKSQPLLAGYLAFAGCFQWFKGTNLKANHNKGFDIMQEKLVVSNGSKVQIWKQITTQNQQVFFDSELFPMVQRYKFESKSQQGIIMLLMRHCCFQWFKGTNLKANHNYYT